MIYAPTVMCPRGTSIWFLYGDVVDCTAAHILPSIIPIHRFHSFMSTVIIFPPARVNSKDLGVSNPASVPWPRLRSWKAAKTWRRRLAAWQRRWAMHTSTPSAFFLHRPKKKAASKGMKHNAALLKIHD